MMSTVNPKIKEFESEFKFKLIESTPDAFIAGFVSNNEHEEPISGIVEFKEQFDSDNQKHFYTIDQWGAGDHLLLIVKVNKDGGIFKFKVKKTEIYDEE